jgi:glycosyltransferase involved in cell wall biosynthesis
MRLLRPSPLLTRPRVSVVVPCHNYGTFLPAAVSSALDHEGVDVDVLIVDDASTDDSAAVAQRLAAEDERVDVLLHETNRGHIATYNDGLAKVSGDYVVLLSADDVLVPDSLTRAAALMDADPRLGLVYGHAPAFTDVVPVLDTRPRSWSVWEPGAWLPPRVRRARNPVYTPSAMMRASALADAGGYDDRVPHAADMLLWYRTAATWGVGRVNNAAQALYRVHGSNMHLTQFAGMLRDLTEQREVVRILFDETPDGADLPPSLRTAAHWSMTRRARRLALAERREGTDPAAAAALDAFADETEASTGGAGVPRVSALADIVLEHRAAALPRRVEAHVKWRRWRRYGV